ncbi:MAG: EAL domain-containing protein [Gallionella sp.]|nr:EAL domain-containing protein [Gallionella sp.]
MKNSKWYARLRKLSVKWKIFLLSAGVFGLSLTASFAYFTHQSYWLNVTTALAGLMNFTDAKQQGVIRFIDQNEKLAMQLASLAEQTDAKTLRSQFRSVVTTDVFRLEEHPFKAEIIAGTREIPTWKVYHAIDYVVNGVIRISSDPQREGKPWNKSINLKAGYSDPYYDGAVPVMTFASQTGGDTVYVHADARMLTNIVNGEIGNMAGDMGAFYLAGVGKTFDYYIVNKENLLITESRARPGQFLEGRGSELPWRTTLQQAGVVCGKNGTYTTDARCTTGCRETMGFYTGVNGKKMLGASMPFYDSSWTLVVEVEEDELLMPMWVMFAQDIGILLLIGALAIYLYLRLQDKVIIHPLNRLQEAIEDVERTQDFSKPIKIDSEDEFGILGNAFNRMSRNLESVYRNLEERVATRTLNLESLNEKLQASLIESEKDKNQIQDLAFYDPLTHLPNRRLLIDRLQHALAYSARNDRKGALLFIDLDNFKNLNDTLGHDIGDSLLKQVAQRLESCVREGDTVSRVGGDEFVVILEDLSEQDHEAAAQTESVGEKILAALSRPYRLATYECSSTASIGANLFNGNQSDIDELFKQADIAMYQAKKTGRNALCFFDPAMQAFIAARVSLENDLRRAVSEPEQLLLYYQAQVDSSGRLIGAEALVRWQHSERGIVPPDEFIPIAEESGLILPLGRWVLTTACKQLAEWAEQPEMAHLTVAVNVSAKQFHMQTFVEDVLALVDRFGVDPAKLKLEITESLLLDNVDSIIAKMTTLEARGIDFSMDDFGTGYSSLSYLKRLPLYQLKIDRSFVRDVLTDPNDAAISRMIISLAQSMNLVVIAEGVETEAQREFLELNGCHAFQGYLFGKPVPIEQFEALLKQG